MKLFQQIPCIPPALVLISALISTISGCNQTEANKTGSTSTAAPQLATQSKQQLAELGRQLFFDKNLSRSGQQSCATCHDPAHAYAPANDLAVQLGGEHMDQQGARAVPSLRYVLNRTPTWHLPFVASLGERIREGIESPSGGFAWDGRFNSLHQQAGFPLLAPNEMANGSMAEISQKLAKADYAEQFRQLFGNRIFETPEQVYQNALLAIERFELDDPSFHPYSSKFDAVLDGKAQLTASEARGFALFNDPEKGNCASCHTATKGADGSHPLFTNFQYEALGVPRNTEIKANANPNYYDLGLCGPSRTELSSHTELCGYFKAPSLRNVASRGVFFHNGYSHSLKSALEFYVQRDTNPQRWYPHSGKNVTKFDDLPKSLRTNVNVIDAPMTSKRGEKPVWNDADVADMIAFLKTLSDADVVNR